MFARAAGARIGGTKGFFRVRGVADLALFAGGRSARIGNASTAIALGAGEAGDTAAGFDALSIQGTAGFVGLASDASARIRTAVSVFAEVGGSGTFGVLAATSGDDANTA